VPFRDDERLAETLVEALSEVARELQVLALSSPTGTTSAW
jgi:hypothetical protein